MLTNKAIKLVEEKWNPPEWPAGPASDYAKAMHARPFAYFRERIRHLGISGSFVVDAGCGTGTWTFALATAFNRVLGIDYIQDRLELAAQLRKQFKLKQPEFIQGDIRKIPVENGKADAVFCYSVALGAVALESLLAEFHRILRPGGVLYLELNGIGYGWNLFSMEGNYKKIGGDVVYNTYGRTALARLVPHIRPDGPSNKEVLDALGSGSPLAAVAAGGDPEALAAAKTIVEELAGDYPELLLADLKAIAGGERDQFSQPSMGRGYAPDEVRAYSARAGFRRFEWAPEGMLSLKPDGTVKSEKCEAAPPISAPEFNGHVRRFESLNWK